MPPLQTGPASLGPGLVLGRYPREREYLKDSGNGRAGKERPPGSPGGRCRASSPIGTRSAGLPFGNGRYPPEGLTEGVHRRWTAPEVLDEDQRTPSVAHGDSSLKAGVRFCSHRRRRYRSSSLFNLQTPLFFALRHSAGAKKIIRYFNSLLHFSVAWNII